jgi:hypothetical protein
VTRECGADSEILLTDSDARAIVNVGLLMPLPQQPITTVREVLATVENAIAVLDRGLMARSAKPG